MRDTKSLLLLLVSLLLVLVSFVLIWTWGYSFYTKNNDTKNNIKSTSTDSISIANKIKDSLQKVYTATLHDLDLQLDSTLSNSDSLKAELEIKLAEFYRLRSEIAVLLKNRNTENNFAIAKQKIGELQTKADDLKMKNQDVEMENKKLNDVLNQISNNDKNPDKNTKPANSIKNNNIEKSNPVYQSFTASDLRLSAIMNAGEKETETNVAAKTDKLNGSFAVINFNSQLTNAEIMVVVTGPDGRALKNSDWDSGTFNTPDGKKVYSYKFNFSYPRGEAKRLFFSLRGGNLTGGNYIMEIYHNGLLIGRTVKMLS
jgi:regulator of replication initiation timing